MKLLQFRDEFDSYLDYNFHELYPELNDLDPGGVCDGEYVDFSIRLPDNTYIGHASVYNIDRKNYEAEVGLSIYSKPHWNKGIGTVAMFELIDWCRISGFHRLKTRVLKTNVRALRHEEKCGFRKYGEQKIGNSEFILLERCPL